MDSKSKLVIFCGVLLLNSVVHDGVAVASGDPVEGKKIFAQTCAACHGPTGKGITGLGKPLNDATFLSTNDDAAIQQVIMTGRPGTMMVGFAQLGENRVADLVAYIRAWQTAGDESAVRGDPVKGRQIFDGHCVSCHRDIQQYLSKVDEPGVMPVVNIIHTDTSTRDFTGAHTWVGLDNQQIQDITVYLKNFHGSESEGRDLARLAETEVAAASVLLPHALANAAGEVVGKIGTPEDILLGQELFQGRKRFKNLGPSCIACHHVKNDAVIGGGVLAKDLTTVFTRMGSTGVESILGQPPFPVMAQAYKNGPLMPDEINALVAFLQHTDRENLMQKPRDYGVRLMVVGGIGALLIIASYSLIWNRRKKKKVNQDIFDRQIKSE